MLFVLMGLFGGYCSARLYKSFRGDAWKLTTFRTALMFPGACQHRYFIVLITYIYYV